MVVQAMDALKDKILALESPQKKFPWNKELSKYYENTLSGKIQKTTQCTVVENLPGNDMSVNLNELVGIFFGTRTGENGISIQSDNSIVIPGVAEMNSLYAIAERQMGSIASEKNNGGHLDGVYISQLFTSSTGVKFIVNIKMETDGMGNTPVPQIVKTSILYPEREGQTPTPVEYEYYDDALLPYSRDSMDELLLGILGDEAAGFKLREIIVDAYSTDPNDSLGIRIEGRDPSTLIMESDVEIQMHTYSDFNNTGGYNIIDRAERLDISRAGDVDNALRFEGYQQTETRTMATDRNELVPFLFTTGGVFQECSDVNPALNTAVFTKAPDNFVARTPQGGMFVEQIAILGAVVYVLIKGKIFRR